MKKLYVGIVGLGKISTIYLDNLSTVFSKWVTIAGVTDLVGERVKEVSERYGVPSFADYQGLLSDPGIDLILNLTTPQSHFTLCRDALLAGKHVYVEKPLSLTAGEAEALVLLAKERRLIIGGAPDTFLGAGIQTCRKAIDDALIGEIIGASAFMMNHGHESWHPDPEFYYKSGGGPLFDMGPYYITALVNLMGPVEAVSGVAKKSFEKRTITSEPKNGSIISVEVDTHVTGLLTFKSGAVATLVTSFDVWYHTMPNIEIYGTKGALRVPDPNTFGGPVLYCKAGSKEWEELPLVFDYAKNSRGLGVADIAWALEGATTPRASGDLALHVVEVMEGLLKASDLRSSVEMQHQCDRPAPLW